MSAIDQISETERQSWITLIADGLVFIWFWKTMAPGWSLMPDSFSPANIGKIYFNLVIITIIYHAVIAGFFALRTKSSGGLQDERDLAIVADGTKFGYHAQQLALGVIIVTAILSYVGGSDYIGPISLDNPVQFLFVLTLIAYAADLLRHGVIVARYRFS